MRRMAIAVGVAAILLVGGIVPLGAQQPKLTLPGIPNPGVASYAPEIGKYGGTLRHLADQRPAHLQPDRRAGHGVDRRHGSPV